MYWSALFNNASNKSRVSTFISLMLVSSISCHLPFALLLYGVYFFHGFEMIVIKTYAYFSRGLSIVRRFL